MAKPYKNGLVSHTAEYPSYEAREWLNEGFGYDEIEEEPFTVPAADTDGRCRIELDHSIDVSQRVIVVCDGTTCDLVAYGASIGGTQAGVQTGENLPPIIEFAVAQAGKTGTVTYTPIGTNGSAGRLNQIERELEAIEGASSLTPRLIATVTGINAKTTGNTTLLATTGAGRMFMVVLTVTAASGITQGPEVGIGVASGENDMWLETQTNLTSTTGANSQYTFFAQGSGRFSYAGSETIKLGLDTAAIGTSMTFKADIYVIQ